MSSTLTPAAGVQQTVRNRLAHHREQNGGKPAQMHAGLNIGRMHKSVIFGRIVRMERCCAEDVAAMALVFRQCRRVAGPLRKAREPAFAVPMIRQQATGGADARRRPGVLFALRVDIHAVARFFPRPAVRVPDQHARDKRPRLFVKPLPQQPCGQRIISDRSPCLAGHRA